MLVLVSRENLKWLNFLRLGLPTEDSEIFHGFHIVRTLSPNSLPEMCFRPMTSPYPNGLATIASLNASSSAWARDI